MNGSSHFLIRSLTLAVAQGLSLVDPSASAANSENAIFFNEKITFPLETGIGDTQLAPIIQSATFREIP
jgi:hypothetical protein